MGVVLQGCDLKSRYRHLDITRGLGLVLGNAMAEGRSVRSQNNTNSTTSHLLIHPVF
ncbi:hypothetical protein [Acaryochloris marina]|uniref:hypothetical protein n=1 Tax=Acaryochloris marina TaxID=155978 RepID=UPI001BAF42D3|nr:hypothetical protein [Acaryochloris marina]QUY46288.1 hypothetical protein I1H34_31805 [Acaryochloris marina S15]